MATNPLVSVIVPIYKVEPYLRRCLDSIIGQTYQNLEIILVDDGSPDKCPEICDEYAAKAMKKLPRLRDCEVHSTVILGEQDAATYQRLGMRVTCTPKYQSKNLFHR